MIACYLAAMLSCNNKKAEKMNTEIPKISDFPTGEENAVYAQYFTGKSYLATLTTNKDLNVPMANITFEPGCRNNWHRHTGGQILIVVGGEGLYQERGKRSRHLQLGDVVEIAAHVEHWHGATANSWFSHIGITCNPTINENVWLEAVTDKVFGEANDQIKK
ncbi:cupin domain-containing protein [Pedobacter sp. MC2016-24]|nr:cupin domain-containing protein [Pedobacter sp. MC2016-24]